MAKSVKTLEVIAWPDLGCEAVRRLTVEQMPTHVAGLPVAVNVSCHVTRRASASL